MFSEIDAPTLMQEKISEAYAIIDVRSPGEYKEATIPGSINVPLFDNDERAEVGTLYKQQGKKEATDRGLEIFSAKLPAFIKTCTEIAGNKPIVVFCWRGGMRSKTAATLLDLIGLRVKRLSGGIKAYRTFTLKSLSDVQAFPPLLVINGKTGNGKTALLHLLENSGHATIDLEGLAGHRGSIFGHIGKEPSNQKTFDYLLIEALMRHQSAPFILIEGESKRIGKVRLPDHFYEAKEKSQQLFVELPLSRRVMQILADYQPSIHHEHLWSAFEKIKKRIHTPIAKDIKEAFEQKDYPLVVRLLLTYYYDPRYQHSTTVADHRSRTFTAEHIDEVFKQMSDYLDHFSPSQAED